MRRKQMVIHARRLRMEGEVAGLSASQMAHSVGLRLSDKWNLSSGEKPEASVQIKLE